MGENFGLMGENFGLMGEKVTCTHNTSPTCDLCNAHNFQDEQHVLLSTAPIHTGSLCRTQEPLFPPTVRGPVTGFHDASELEKQQDMFFFMHFCLLHSNTMMYGQASILGS